ncbi:nucleotidyltransferase family protein [Celeribacter sp.]|uniref:nucleotidyltransferase family protein n=1 Tax=Celeribacter sp. TaxID=1890673 RepID=UPI003A90EB4B
MLFCAGRGTRMGPLTSIMPKPMIKVRERPLVDYALDIVADVPKKIANTHYLPDELETHLAEHGVQVVRESILLETGGGLKNAARLISGDTCFTLNTDTVWIGGTPVETLCAQWNPSIMDALLLTVPSENTRGHNGTGDFALDDNGRLARGGDFVYTGLQITKLSAVTRVPDTAFSMNKAWNAIHTDGRLYGAVFDGIWCDVGSPEGIARAEEELEEAAYVSAK